VIAALGLASAAQAQTTCAGDARTADACRKAGDLVSFLTPQLSTALAGGSATLGQGGALGGWGHFAVDVRGTAVNGSLPQLDGVGFGTGTSAEAGSFKSENQFVPGVSANLGVGLWRGYSLGVTRIGGVDALVTATYLPSVSGEDIKLDAKGGNTKLGFGVRLGLLEESVLTPGVSITYMKRDLPTLSVSGAVTASGSRPGGSFALNDYALKTSAWRITAGKDLLFLNLTAGYGQDKYESSSNLAMTVNAPAPIGTVSGTGASKLSMTRNNVYVGAAINLLLIKLVGEVGQVSGGSVPTLLNNFGSDPAKSRTYFTVGVRVGL
jgi:hypothetical protein